MLANITTMIDDLIPRDIGLHGGGEGETAPAETSGDVIDAMELEWQMEELLRLSNCTCNRTYTHANVLHKRTTKHSERHAALQQAKRTQKLHTH